MQSGFPEGGWGVVEREVTREYTADALGSPGAEVLATPWLVAFAEMASAKVMEAHLGSGQATVGVHLEISHLAATPLGLKVTVRSQLVRVEGRRLFFRFEAHDDVEKVAEGTHERAVVDLRRIMDKAQAKKKAL